MITWRFVILFLATWYAFYALLQATPLESEARAANDGAPVGPAAALTEDAGGLGRGAAESPPAGSAGSFAFG